MMDGHRSNDEILVTTWSSPRWFEFPPTGARIAGFGLGDRTGSDRTTLLVTNFPPGQVLAAHSHDTDMVDVIVQGSLERDGEVWGTGTLRFVPRGVVYSSATVGAEGVTMLEFYGERRGLIGDGLGDELLPMGADAVAAIFDEMLGSG